jgi:penicillin-binding protein 1C
VRCVAAVMRAVWVLAALPAFAAVPSFDHVKRAHQPSDLQLTDRHGAPLQSVRIDATVRRFAWMPLDEMSPALRDAIVFSEDRRFWEHSGVDWQALAGAAWNNAWNRRTRGASTLTMQLAGLLDGELARPAGGRSAAQKLGQVASAAALDGTWSKTQVLEAYLNLVPLRGDTVGVPAAAWQLFGKRPSGLDAVESALLAVLVRAPNANAAAASKRACDVLQQQRLRCDGVATAVEQALARRPQAAPGEALAPHFARAWLGAGGGARTSLDAGVQRVALAALRQQLAELRGRNVDDGAVVVLDNASGDVLAWVGSSGPTSSAAAVDAVLARRQPGSTLKPFVYGLAFERRLVTPASRLDDSPLELAAGSGLYAPQNYDRAFKGEVSARIALGSSLNVPAVRVGSMLGPDALFEGLQRAGLALQQNAGYHGAALALGSAEVTLLDLTNGYRMFANGGRWSAVRLGTKPAPARRALDPAAAFLVADILADASARATTFGFDSPLVTRSWAAVKTGTSKDLRDNWCVGFTSRYTVGVWVGNAGGEPMHAVSGVTGAAPVWRDVVAALHADAPSRAPRPPVGIQSVGNERFIAGTAAVKPGRAGRFGIVSPRDGSVIAIDPDVPPAQLRLVFEGANGRWELDGRALGSGETRVWLPQPGRHVLRLRAADGAVDEVSFEVRPLPQDAGAKMRSTAASMTMPHRL